MKRSKDDEREMERLEKREGKEDVENGERTEIRKHEFATPGWNMR